MNISDKLRYLIAGGWNTLFGYTLGVVALNCLHGILNTVLIGILCNLAGITMSFLTYKLFVFKTKGSWLAEYLRCYAVYGSVALIGVLVLWFLVDYCSMAYWLAQGLVVVLTVIVSYLGHAKFTFAIGTRKMGN